MNIAVFSELWPSGRDAAEGLFVADQVEVLRSAGHSVAVFTPPRHPGWPRATRLPAMLAMLPAFAAANNRHRFDIIHAHNLMTAGVVGRLASLWHGVPLVITDHCSPPSINASGWIESYMVESAARGAHGFCAVSDDAAWELCRIGWRLPAVLPNVVREEFFAISRSRREAKKVLFAGGFRDQKAVIESVEAAIRCPQKTFLFYGAGPLMERVNRLVDGADHIMVLERGRGCDGRATFKNLLDWADVFLSPSKHETFGLAAVEAAAAGLRVIAGSETPTPLLIGRGCVASKPEADAIISALDQVSGQPPPDRDSLRARYGEDAFLAAATGAYQAAINATIDPLVLAST